MLTRNFFVEVGWVSGDAGAIYLEGGTVSMGKAEEAEAGIRSVSKDTKT